MRNITKDIPSMNQQPFSFCCTHCNTGMHFIGKNKKREQTGEKVHLHCGTCNANTTPEGKGSKNNCGVFLFIDEVTELK